MSTYVWISSNDVIDIMKKFSQAKEFLIIIGKSKSSLHGLTSSDFSPTTDTWQWLVVSAFQMYVLHFRHFFENRKNLGLTPGQNDDPVTRTWKMTQMTHWPGGPMTQFHVCCRQVESHLMQKYRNSSRTTELWMTSVCFLFCLLSSEADSGAGSCFYFSAKILSISDLQVISCLFYISSIILV